MTAQKAEMVPDPSIRFPSPVMKSKPGRATMTAATGSTMLNIRVGAPLLGAIIKASAATSGSAPSRRSFPSSRTRCSAVFIGPMFQSVKTTKSARTTAKIA